MNRKKIIKINKMLIDDYGVIVNVNHNDQPFLDNEQEKIWVEIHNNSFWYKYRQQLIFKLLKKFNFSKEVLDVGSGIGTTSIFLSSKGYQVESIEPSYKSCVISKKRGIERIINTNIFDGDIKINEKINVLLLDVLEHVKNDNLFLKNLCLKCKKSTLFLTVPAYNFLWSYEDKHASHFRRYTLSEITNKLSDAGFKIHFSTYFFSFLIIPILIFRSIPYRINLKTKKKDNKFNQHVPNRFFNRIFQILQRIEIQFISNKKKIYFGSSILVIATN